MNLTTATPVEIDTALAEIYGRYYSHQDQVAKITAWIEDMEQGLAKFEAGDRRYSSYSQDSLDRLLAQREGAEVAAAEALAETRPYQAEYNSRPWSRFFIVQNNGGHIHSSMGCSTCFVTTRFGWLPEFSGQTEAEAVAKHGAILCTVCYPTAPVEWTDRRDDSVCPGSGQHYTQPSRTGYYSGNWGTCTGCGERQTVSKTGNIRKHKKA